MQLKFLIIPAILICNGAIAQTGTATTAVSQGINPTPAPAVSPAPVTPVASPDGAPVTTPAPAATPLSSPVSPDASTASSSSSRTRYLDYKSVYEAETVEEEVKMATERFGLTESQQDVWLSAATDRRITEKQAREKLDSKANDYDKNAVYSGLRAAHTHFHEVLVGYLTPAQKQALENDRLILHEKQQRIAKLPPPPPPTPTVAPVDSTAIKAALEAENDKKKGKKSKKKKKPAAG